ncbi:hypothetical protein K439DRAFT_1506978 [Ramaria rubella]|nr:hypothetical protein K439DRAFT_1506978 [Ramaria rubella]
MAEQTESLFPENLDGRPPVSKTLYRVATRDTKHPQATMNGAEPPPPPYEAVQPVSEPADVGHSSEDSLEAAERSMLQPIRLRLRIPARPKPSAVLNISSSETEAESALQVLRPEPAVPLAIPKGAKKKRKKRKAPPAEVDSDGVLESDGVAQSAPRDKRRRGSSTMSDELGGMKPGRMSAECVIQVEQPLVRVAKGKGTHKLVKQDPLRFGPIDILTTTEWEGFLDQITEACETTRGCLNTASLTWRWSKPANSPIMLLSTEVAFLSLQKKIGPKQPTVIVGMKPPRMPENVRAPWAGGGTDNRGNDTQVHGHL